MYTYNFIDDTKGREENLCVAAFVHSQFCYFYHDEPIKINGKFAILSHRLRSNKSNNFYCAFLY